MCIPTYVYIHIDLEFSDIITFHSPSIWSDLIGKKGSFRMAPDGPPPMPVSVSEIVFFFTKSVSCGAMLRTILTILSYC